MSADSTIADLTADPTSNTPDPTISNTPDPTKPLLIKQLGSKKLDVSHEGAPVVSASTEGDSEQKGSFSFLRGNNGKIFGLFGGRKSKKNNKKKRGGSKKNKSNKKRRSGKKSNKKR